MFTPLLLVLLLVDVMDLIFAVDSIPAVFAITTDQFIVYTSNVFAILGLRSLYFVLAGIVDRFRFLRIGLAVILVFFGARLLLSTVIEFPNQVSLAVIAVALAISVVASVKRPENRPA